MIIYGVNPVLEAIRSHPDRVRYVGVAREQTSRHQNVIGGAKNVGLSVRAMQGDQIDRLASRGVHNGVVAEVSESAYIDFDDAIASAKFVLILDGITDPQNLGAILRVADGFGVDLVVLPEHDSVGLTPAAVKASAGPGGGGCVRVGVWVAEVTPAARAMEAPQRAGFGVYGAAAGGDPPAAIDFTGRVALVLG